MNRLMIALCVALPALPLAACAGGYYGGAAYAGGPYGYSGYYDDYYGPIYDGYWGDDGAFYYRSGAHDRHYRRGDSSHFSRTEARGANFHSFQGSLAADSDTHLQHFRRNPTPSGGSQGDHGDRHDH